MTTVDQPPSLLCQEFPGAAPPQELEAAGAIQQLLLQANLPEVPGFGLASFCRSAREIGGDFFDVRRDANGNLWLTIADVMGKGVAAALFATTLGPLLHALAPHSRSPGQLLTNLNSALVDELSRVDMFITAQIVHADLLHRRISVAGAGHCPLLLAGPRNAIEPVFSEDLPLGLAADVEFHEVSTALNPGGAVLLYTDGIIEARNLQGHPFGQERLEACLLHGIGRGASALELRHTLLNALNLFQNGAPPADDQTFVLLQEERSLAAIPECAENPADCP